MKLFLIGKLTHDEFKSCLRALGYDLPVAEEEGEEEPEFDAILAIVDPNKDGSVQLQVMIEFSYFYGFRLGYVTEASHLSSKAIECKWVCVFVELLPKLQWLLFKPDFQKELPFITYFEFFQENY